MRQVASKLSGGQPPARVVATGFADGGALARVAAAFAAGSWPSAHVRCISFGAQRTGDHWCFRMSTKNLCRASPVLLAAGRPMQSAQQFIQCPSGSGPCTTL